jgi:hypothetical protein
VTTARASAGRPDQSKSVPGALQSPALAGVTAWTSSTIKTDSSWVLNHRLRVSHTLSLHVDSSRRSNGSNAQIPVIPKRRGKWVKSTHSNGLRCDAQNKLAATEFHIDSADLRVLEFIELVSLTEVWRVA